MPCSESKLWNSGSCVARCPELGVTPQGKDVEGARASLREAIELNLRDLGLPTAA